MQLDQWPSTWPKRSLPLRVKQRGESVGVDDLIQHKPRRRPAPPVTQPLVSKLQARKTWAENRSHRRTIPRERQLYSTRRRLLFENRPDLGLCPEARSRAGIADRR